MRASMINRDRPHSSETMSFWRGIPENKFQIFVRRLRVMLRPAASARVDQKYIVTTHVYHIDEELKPYPEILHDSMSPATCGGRRITRRIFQMLVDVLRPGDAGKPLSQGATPENDENVALVIAPPKEAKAWPAGSVRNLFVDEFRPSAMQRSIDELSVISSWRITVPSTKGRGRPK